MRSSPLLEIHEAIVQHRTIDAGHPDFEGHFPEFPLLPAVSQIDLVIDLISVQLGLDLICSAVEKAKFKAMLRPDASITIRVEGAGPQRARWLITGEGKIYSQGLIHFAPQANRSRKLRVESKAE